MSSQTSCIRPCSLFLELPEDLLEAETLLGVELLPREQAVALHGDHLLEAALPPTRLSSPITNETKSRYGLQRMGGTDAGLGEERAHLGLVVLRIAMTG